MSIFKFVKRVFDILSASILLIVISPLLSVLAIAVRINLGRPILFKQKRSGLGMRPYWMLKFRTMTDSRDEQGNLLPDHLRVTRFGVFLRSTSLDELPELFNIIKGDMSVIGPRPLPCEYDNYYKENELLRFDVRGGLVSPDVVTGLPVVPWDCQLEAEGDYGSSPSLKKDIVILFSVFKTLLNRADANFGSYERVPLNVERANMKKQENEEYTCDSATCR